MTLARVIEAGSRAVVYDGATNALTALDAVGAAVARRRLATGEGPAALRAALAADFGDAAVQAALRELAAEGLFSPAPAPPGAPARPLPLRTLVLHLAQDCNMACTYCYAAGGTYGGARRAMTAETADRALAMLLAEGDEKVHVTFFGGEPMLNWPVMRHAIEAGEARAKAAGKRITFSFTTNGSLLTEDRVDFLAAHRVGVSVSLDGPADLQDARRPFRGGAPSAAVVTPKVAMLLARHRTRPVGARVTLTHGHAEVLRQFTHLTALGFAEVGFAPATSADPAVHLDDAELSAVLADLGALAERAADVAIAGGHLGLSNIANLWTEIHTGRTRGFACGAGLGLLSVGVDGDLAPCHRFNGEAAFGVGDLATGVDRARLDAFLAEVHVARKPGCTACWARSLCAGGCYHEAWTRHGDHAASNHHACDFIRAWIGIGLSTYARVWEADPTYFDRLAARGS